MLTVGVVSAQNEVARYVKMAADQANAAAQNNYGGVVRNHPEAVRYLKMAAYRMNTSTQGIHCLARHAPH